MPLLRLALPTPLPRLFDYLPAKGQHLPQPGVRVQVPFGNRQLVGLLVGFTEDSSVPVSKLKAARDYLDQEPLFDAEHLDFLIWVANYYHQPLGEVVQIALPALLRQGQALHPPQQPRWQLTVQGQGLDTRELAKAPRQKALLEYLKRHSGAPQQKDILGAGFNLPQLKALEEKGLIESFTLGRSNQGVGLPLLDVAAPRPREVLAEVPLKLTSEQDEVVQKLIASLGRFQPHLLLGVTGSGKTEVYLQLIQQVLERGQQVLVLIPEIGLTPQTLGRFQKRFNRRVAALHSGMTDRERLNAWRSAMEGKADIVLGTRSAIFTPLPRLGLLVIDEEHDASFKQQDSVRYQARDLAVLRAKRAGVPVVLGSATPSLESLAHAFSGDYQLHHLRQRPEAHIELPQPKLLDIRSRKLEGGFSQPLLKLIEKHLKAGNQVLVLLNRRGFAPVLMCTECGWIAGCLNCDARMTWHREPAKLHCHHCDTQQPLPSACPQCGHTELLPLGSGTERAEETLQERFPEIPIIRIDRDTTKGRSALQSKLDQIAHAKPGILLGTQMLAKGHHFPDVTLATVLDADHGLYSSDPRAMERTAQLLIQVAGRAGRAEKPGEVVIQTHHSDDPRLEKLCVDGYEALAKELLDERRKTNWPPYAYLAIWRVEAPQKEVVEAFMQALNEQAKYYLAEQPEAVSLLGPVPAPMERRQGRYHMQLLLHADKRAPLHRFIQRLLPWLETTPLARKVRWSLDIDPDDLF
ncbi:replication restart DNA helicase PriA [Marinospirillum celere]|uniref:Replication restart protein PriA n=1 Tax=Marinospirillum celere TaxID=1122252 RepID=A0A1I1ITC1_9GAMM|nr:primosomal protein N' [Marinospirillum celere]SFC37558.1 replication restart DNA helicase PriA [Marinospirillum celere]